MLVVDDQRKKKKVTQKESEVKRFRTFYLEPSIPKKGFQKPSAQTGARLLFRWATDPTLGEGRRAPPWSPPGEGAAMDGVKSPEFERVPLWTWL